jgi:hypothetical protein
MAFIKLQFKPGVNRDQTDYSNEGGWYACDKIRFRSGYPEKIGGWQKTTPSAFIGVCRQMYNWATTFGDNFVSLGTNEKLYIENGGNLFNVTPLRATMNSPDTDNSINTTNGSTTVVVNLGAPHGAVTGSYAQISGATGASIGGIPIAQINTNHKITVIDADSFSFVVTTAATSTVSNAGGTAVVIQFEIAPGNAVTIKGTGWGVGTWGRDTWGLGSTTGGINLPQRDWWFDNFDNDLVMNIRDGAAYWWARGTNANPTSALATRAITLASYATAEGFDANAVPAKVMQLLVSQQDRHLIAFGAVPFGSTNPADFDPMLIRWADQDTPGDWTPTTTNSAGDIRVSRGSKIVRALPTRQEILVWTDAALYTLQFLGTTDVFALQEYADNVSIASPRAVATASNVTYWMGRDKFYAYTGRVETVPCSLRNHVFKNINFTQADQIICSTNEEWNEIWWFYPTANSFYNNAYVVYNHLERVWYYGSLDRTAWLDSPLREYPMAANSPVSVSGTTVTVGNGYMYDHERGIDADGAPMSSFIESSDFDLEDGDQFMLIRRLVPDITFNGSTATSPEVTFRITPRNFPGTAVYTDSSDTQRVVETTIGQFTPQVFIRARARQMALKVMSENSGVQWQLGAPRLDARADGRRA